MRYDFDKLTNVATLVVVVCAVCVTLLVAYQRLVSAPGLASNEAREVPQWRRYAEGAHLLGPADARVTIIEFGDYQCPACRTWQLQIEEVLREYPEDVAFIYRHWPLSYHEHAYLAARAAECAGAQGVFWAFHRLLFEDENWHGDAMTRFAEEAGVNDLDEFGRCLGDSSPVPVIEAGIAAAHEIDAAGTPAVIVNGVLLAIPPDSETLRMMIQEGR